MFSLCGWRFVQRDNVSSLYFPPWLEASPVLFASKATQFFFFFFTKFIICHQPDQEQICLSVETD